MPTTLEIAQVEASLAAAERARFATSAGAAGVVGTLSVLRRWWTGASQPPRQIASVPVNNERFEYGE